MCGVFCAVFAVHMDPERAATEASRSQVKPSITVLLTFHCTRDTRFPDRVLMAFTTPQAKRLLQGDPESRVEDSTKAPNREEACRSGQILSPQLSLLL
jgi:hypothetical protein